MSDLLHSELCAAAVKWLKKSAGCGVAITEMVSVAGEIPDAIGWRSGVSILIEVKTTRSDFLADRKKAWRIDATLGMGDWRFFLAPKGLLMPDEIPAGWGLLEITEKGVKRTHRVPIGNCSWGSPPLMGNKRAETILLCSALRRIDKTLK